MNLWSNLVHVCTYVWNVMFVKLLHEDFVKYSQTFLHKDFTKLHEVFANFSVHSTIGTCRKRYQKHRPRPVLCSFVDMHQLVEFMVSSFVVLNQLVDFMVFGSLALLLTCINLLSLWYFLLLTCINLLTLWYLDPLRTGTRARQLAMMSIGNVSGRHNSTKVTRAPKKFLSSGFRHSAPSLEIGRSTYLTTAVSRDRFQLDL